MDRKLLKVYVCPVSHTALKASADDAQEISEGELVAEGGLPYKVREGLPIFVSSGLLSEAERNTQAEYRRHRGRKIRCRG